MLTGMTLKVFLNELREQGGSQTFSHVVKVGDLMAELALAMGMSEKEANTMFYAGLLHDAGKLFVPANILSKQETLTDHEYLIIRTHVTSGTGIIKQLHIHDYLKKAACEAAEYHHAWYNGQKKRPGSRQGGYYKGMKSSNVSKTAIPLVGRMCAICDVYEALTAERSYSAAMSCDEALKKMDEFLIEGQFDPKIYKIFVEKVLKKEYLSSKKVA